MIVQCGQWAFRQLALERTICFAYLRAHLKTIDIVIEANNFQFYLSALQTRLIKTNFVTALGNINLIKTILFLLKVLNLVNGLK